MTGVVVGASGGIGSECAIALAPAVTRLVLVGRSREKLAETARRAGRHSVTVEADITTVSGREAVAEAASANLSWVVIASGMPLRGRLVEVLPSAIEETIVSNFLAPALLIRRLLECEWNENGAIVAVGSISASRALPNRAVYGGSKAGLEHMCRTLAAELAPRGIRVNVVAPGVIETPFLGTDSGALSSWIADRVPAKRSGTASEVAELVRYVVLEAPRYMTGARIAVDGGAEVVG